MSRNAIVIASWGFPPQWRRAKYRLHLVDRGYNIDFSCETCCSTVALAAALNLKESVNLCKVVVIGADSVLSPENFSDGVSFRKGVKNAFKGFVQALLRKENCACCESLSPDVFDVFIIPGIGKYYGYQFNGTIEQIFVSVFYRVLAVLREVKKADIFLDITHGINYQVVASLYATIAAILSFDPALEGRLFIVNSEPYPPGYRSKICITAQRPPLFEGAPILGIQNFSALHNVIRIIRALSGLYFLNEQPLSRILALIKEKELNAYFKDLVIFFRFLRLGLAGLLYPNSNSPYSAKEINEKILKFYEATRKEIFGEENIDENVKALDEKLFIPEIDHSRKNITYPPAKTYCVIVENLEQIRKNIIQELAEKTTLKDFLSSLLKVYENKGLIDKKHIIERERDSFMNIIEKLKNISKEKIWTQKLIALAWSAIKGIPFIEEKIGKFDLRTLFAHAGLSHTIIKQIKIHNNEEYIHFDEKQIEKIIKRIK